MTQLFKMVYRGTLGTAGEIFAYSMWVSTPGSGVLPGAISDAGSASISDFMEEASVGSVGATTTASDFWGDDVVWVECAVREYVIATGVPLGDGYTISSITDIAGTGPGVSLPYQVAEVVTIDRGGLGRARWNRHYLPPLENNASFIRSNDRMQTGVPDTLVNATVALDGALSGHESGLGICHYSFKDHTVTARPTVKVGDIWDTQRRRRNQLVETYTATLLT